MWINFRAVWPLNRVFLQLDVWTAKLNFYIGGFFYGRIYSTTPHENQLESLVSGLLISCEPHKIKIWSHVPREKTIIMFEWSWSIGYLTPDYQSLLVVCLFFSSAGNWLNLMDPRQLLVNRPWQNHKVFFLAIGHHWTKSWKGARALLNIAGPIYFILGPLTVLFFMSSCINPPTFLVNPRPRS